MESFVSKSLTFLILIVPAVVPQKDTHCYWASTNRVWRMSSFTESFQFVFCVKGGETTRNEVLSRTFKIVCDCSKYRLHIAKCEFCHMDFMHCFFFGQQPMQYLNLYFFFQNNATPNLSQITWNENTRSIVTRPRIYPIFSLRSLC
ncbi:uncharacterized protein MONOS_14486 [Monocercomonoides exilis]|uniref:uncharacterized protein n=1 Tax=Monocercomonoides exilis TaxID=2049356 RepID=UPI00355ABB99|nr:hypothetical protein MONOS_14486 [Monocercomonoides exilis]